MLHSSDLLTYTRVRYNAVIQTGEYLMSIGRPVISNEECLDLMTERLLNGLITVYGVTGSILQSSFYTEVSGLRKTAWRTFAPVPLPICRSCWILPYTTRTSWKISIVRNSPRQFCRHQGQRQSGFGTLESSGLDAGVSAVTADNTVVNMIFILSGSAGIRKTI